MMQQTGVDAIVIGGGVIGSSIAYHLSVLGVPTVVVEPDPTYRFASTTLSDGNVRIQFDLEENILISRHTMEVMKTFADTMAVGEWRPDPAPRRQGNLFLTDDRAAAESGMALQRSLGCLVEWLDLDEIRKRWPQLELTGVLGGTFGPDDGTVDPSAVLHGYRRKAIDLGARYESSRVESIVIRAGRATGVVLDDATELSADHIVVAAGAWSSDVMRTAGVTIPVTPVMRNVFVVRSDVPTSGCPSVFLPGATYVIPEHDVWLMARSTSDDPVGFDFRVRHHRFHDVVWPAVIEKLEAFDKLDVVRSWAGLYAVNTLDHNAILGPWPEIDGLHLATGFSGHGFQQAPAVGRYVAEGIAGVAHALDLRRLGAERIVEGRPLEEAAGRII